MPDIDKLKADLKLRLQKLKEEKRNLAESYTEKTTSQAFVKGNEGNQETELQTYHLPSDAMNTNGDGLEITASGEFARNSNKKQVKMYFGDTLIYDSGLIGNKTDKWDASAIIKRTKSKEQDVSAVLTVNNSPSDPARLKPTEDVSKEVLIKITGQGVENKDVILKNLSVKILKTAE